MSKEFENGEKSLFLLLFVAAAGLALISGSCGSSPTSPKPTPTPSFSTSAVTVVSKTDFYPTGLGFQGGNMWVLNAVSNPALEEFNSSFSQSASITTFDGSTTFNSDPYDVKSGPDGSLYVADYHNGQVEVFSSSGTYQTVITGLADVTDAVVNSGGTTLYVLTQAPAIETFVITLASPNTYTHETAFTTTSSGVGVLSGPQYMALDSSNNVYVTNQGYGSIVRYGPTGDNPVSFGAADLSAPEGIAVNSAGTTLFVSQGAGGCVGFLQEFTLSGGAYSAGVTFANSVISCPWALASDGSGNLYLANYGDNNILEFKYTP